MVLQLLLMHLIPLSIVSLGMLFAFAFAITSRSLLLLFGSAPPSLTATAANVRNCFTKGGGNVGTQGCVAYMFDEKGQIIIDKEECDMDPDELMMTAIDAGAEDFQDEEDSYEVITDPNEFSVVREALEAAGVAMAQAEVTMIPQNYVELTDDEAIKKMNLQNRFFIHYMKNSLY